MSDPADADRPFLDVLAAVSDEQWTTLWEAADALEGATTFAAWSGGEVVNTTVVDGVERPAMQMPYPVYTAAVERLRDAIGGGGLVVRFDWMAWDGMGRYRDGAGLADAPVADAVRLITAIIRSERFGDGNIEGALKRGTLQAAIARLRADHG